MNMAQDPSTDADSLGRTSVTRLVSICIERKRPRTLVLKAFSYFFNAVKNQLAVFRPRLALGKQLWLLTS
jgi:hypothetical protein